MFSRIWSSRGDCARPAPLIQNEKTSEAIDTGDKLHVNNTGVKSLDTAEEEVETCHTLSDRDAYQTRHSNCVTRRLRFNSSKMWQI